METLTLRGETLHTDLTDDEAVQIVGRINQAYQAYAIGASLAADRRRFGSLFPNKRYLLHKLAMEQLRREGNGGREQNEPAPSGTLPNIAAFLTPVSQRLGSGARVTFSVGEGADEVTVRISRATPGARWPGHFYVTRTDAHSADDYVGRIAPTGEFFPTRACGADVMALLDEFESDPKLYAAAYGVRTGRCFACNMRLEDLISVGIGYGPTCAKNYKLPWGKKALETAVRARQEKGL